MTAGLIGVSHSLGFLPAYGLRVAGGLQVLLDLTEASPVARGVWAGACILLIILGLFLFVAALTLPRRRLASDRVVLSGEQGEGAFGGGRVTMSKRGLRALVAHEVSRDPSVREAAPHLDLGPQGWRVACGLSLLPEASTPEVTKRLTDRVTEALARHTGLPVETVTFDVQLRSLTPERRVH